MRFITTPVANPDEAADLIDRFRSHQEPYGVWLVERASEPIGAVLLKPIPRSDGAAPDEIEIGWRFVPSAWGNGYATEAAQAVVDHAWVSGLDHIVAVTHPDNVASMRVCERLGMRAMGRSTAYYSADVQLFRLDAPN